MGRNPNSPFFRQKLPFVDGQLADESPYVMSNTPFVGIHGFTLVELIITLTIAAILLGLAAPQMSGFVGSSRLTSQVNDLMADINVARSEAIKRNTTTGICASISGTSCTTGGDWANGWLVYANASGGNPFAVVRAHEALSGSNTLGLLINAAPADALLFNSSGLSASGTNPTKFTLCDSRLQKSRVVDIATTGRPAIAEGSC